MLISSGVMSLVWPLMVTRRCQRVAADVHTTERYRLFPNQHKSCEGVCHSTHSYSPPRLATKPARLGARRGGLEFVRNDTSCGNLSSTSPDQLVSGHSAQATCCARFPSPAFTAM